MINNKDEKIKNNIIKERFDSEKIFLIVNERVNDAKRMIELIQPEDNSRFFICKKGAKSEWMQWSILREKATLKIQNILI